MSRSSLLLILILILVSGLTAIAQSKPSQSAPMIATAEPLPPLNQAGAWQAQPAGQQGDLVLSPSDDVCYRIRAYIFKRDDDHAPEFVRSTTCGPRRPHEKNAAWPKAKLVPAN
ncbi:MAG TPA: hypothetical protein VKB58_05065 [Terriglobales bacterium]|nr:hypothetical protein [Terriglobales bacterium]